MSTTAAAETVTPAPTDADTEGVSRGPEVRLGLHGEVLGGDDGLILVTVSPDPASLTDIPAPSTVSVTVAWITGATATCVCKPTEYIASISNCVFAVIVAVVVAVAVT